MLEINEIQRLAAMGQALRPDWPARSLATFLSKHFTGRAYGDVAVALAWVATRTKTETPRLLLEAGAWWKAAATESPSSLRPPTRAEACATCGRAEPDHRSEHIGDHPFVPLGQAAKGRTADGIAAVREAFTEAAAALCGHGVDRQRVKCAECERPTVQPETEETA